MIQTHKIDKFPIILVGRDFWQDLMGWIRKILLKGYANISDNDVDLIHLVDTEDEVIEVLNDFYAEYNLSPNF